MNSVRWRDWTGKATERSSETTQREVDGTMWRAPERERERVSSAGREEDGARTAQQEKGHESTAGEGTREHSRRREQQHDAQTEHEKQKRKP